MAVKRIGDWRSCARFRPTASLLRDTKNGIKLANLSSRVPFIGDWGPLSGGRGSARCTPGTGVTFRTDQELDESYRCYRNRRAVQRPRLRAWSLIAKCLGISQLSAVRAAVNSYFWRGVLEDAVWPPPCVRLGSLGDLESPLRLIHDQHGYASPLGYNLNFFGRVCGSVSDNHRLAARVER